MNLIALEYFAGRKMESGMGRIPDRKRQSRADFRPPDDQTLKEAALEARLCR